MCVCVYVHVYILYTVYDDYKIHSHERKKEKFYVGFGMYSRCVQGVCVFVCTFRLNCMMTLKYLYNHEGKQ